MVQRWGASGRPVSASDRGFAHGFKGRSRRDLSRTQSTVVFLASQVSSSDASVVGEVAITVNHHAYLGPSRRSERLIVIASIMDGTSCVSEVQISSSEQLFLVPQIMRKDCGRIGRIPPGCWVLWGGGCVAGWVAGSRVWWETRSLVVAAVVVVVVSELT